MSKLFYRAIGEGSPLLILHGLFGSHDNWLTIAHLLASRYRVILPDLRNHGRSPHEDSMDYDSMASDVVELLEALSLEHASLTGHSMGGKVAMATALLWPERVTSLVVVDIAPKEYPPRHGNILGALSRLKLEQFSNRAEIEAILESAIPDIVVRRFLLKNLARTQTGRYRWKMNLRGITKSYAHLNAALPDSRPWLGRTLFLRRECSDFILSADEPLIKQMFPKAAIHTIPRADHWVHADAPQEVAKAISDFAGE